MPCQRQSWMCFGCGVLFAGTVLGLFSLQQLAPPRDENVIWRPVMSAIKASVEPMGLEGEAVHGNNNLTGDPGCSKEVVGPSVKSRESNRTLYLAPYTGLANTLQAIASAFLVAHREGFDVKVVLNPNSFGPAMWEQLFEEPKMDSIITTFPDGAVATADTKSCTVNGAIWEWKHFTVDWEKVDEDHEIRCLSSCCLREPPFPDSVRWFYKTLLPSREVQELIDAFKERVEWSKYQWVGVHLRRSDNMGTMRNLIDFGPLRDLVNHTSENDDDVLPVSSYIRTMKKIQQTFPLHDLSKPLRYFLATDNEGAMNQVFKAFPGMVDTFQKDDVLSRLRESVTGMQSAIVDLFLLAACEMLIGTPYSTFSEAANYIGSNLFVEPDFQYIEKVESQN